MRGFSDAYGSWKIICIRLRMRRRSSPLRVVTSVPSKTMRPPVVSTSRITARAKVDLPQPDSPTRPSVSPRFTSSETPSTARTEPIAALEDEALGDREVDADVLGAQRAATAALDAERPRLGAGATLTRPPRPRSRTGRDAHPRRDTSTRPRVRRPAPAPAPAAASRRGSAPATLKQRGGEGAAGDLPRQVRRLALDRHQLAPALGVEARDRLQEPDGVRVARPAVELLGARRARRCARRT